MENTQTSPGKIFGDLIKLRKSIGGLQSKKTAGGPQYAIKSAKDLFIKLRAGLDEHNMNAYPVSHDVQSIAVERGTACVVKVTWCVASDDGSFVLMTGIGHGMDKDDKAAGKASTYASKDALSKGLSLPDKELVDTDDEEGLGDVVLPRGKVAPSRRYAELLGDLHATTGQEGVKLARLSAQAAAKAGEISRDEAVQYLAAEAAHAKAL